MITSVAARGLHEQQLVQATLGSSDLDTAYEMYVYFMHQAAFLLSGKHMRYYSFREEIFTTIMGPFGTIVMGVIFAQINALTSRKNIITHMKLTKMAHIHQAMSALKLPTELQHRIHAYHDFLDLYRKHEVISTLLNSLNAPLAAEVRLCIYFPLIASAAFFHDSTPEAVLRIIGALKDAYCSPGDYVVRKGEHGHEMFFVIKGNAEVLIGDPLHVVHHYGCGAYFGEIALLTKQVRQ